MSGPRKLQNSWYKLWLSCELTRTPALINICVTNNINVQGFFYVGVCVVSPCGPVLQTALHQDASGAEHFQQSIR